MSDAVWGRLAEARPPFGESLDLLDLDLPFLLDFLLLLLLFDLESETETVWR